MTIQIEPAQTRAQLEQFIRFPLWLYRDDPNWVAPLLREQRKRLSPAHNPFFVHADAAFWLARRAGAVVGTISAQVDHLHNQVHNERAGQFGFFETVDDYAVAERLLTTARAWLAQRNVTVMRGPIDFSVNHSTGVLIASDDQPPGFMTTHNPPYYAGLCERFGLTKTVDAYMYKLDLQQFRRGNLEADALPRVIQLAWQVRAQSRVTLRAGRAATIQRDLRAAKPILDEAFARSWGWVPMTDAEYARMLDDLSFADPALMFAAEMDDTLIGFAVVIPDFNQVLKPLRGRLAPFGWLRAWWLMRAGAITHTRFLLLGVRERYRHQGIEALLIARALAAAAQKGYRTIELGYVWETNPVMVQLIQFWGKAHNVRRARTWRVYEIAV